MAKESIVTDEETAPEVAEPAQATHAAEDEAWGTGGADVPHVEAEVKRLRAEVERLGAELKRTQEAARTAEDRKLRALADYDNLQRRVAQERAEDERRAAARTLERLLEPVEILERAVEAAEAGHADAKGLRMALEKSHEALRAIGLDAVPGVGAAFDPRWHQAVAREPDDTPEGTILAVVRPGYRVHGRLLREALVKVSAGPTRPD